MATVQLVAKLADVSHTLVEWDQHIRWSFRVTEEFYKQGEDEMYLGLPLSPWCDRTIHNEFAKSQQGFIQFVVSPLISKLIETAPNNKFKRIFSSTLLSNKNEWERLKETEAYEVLHISENIREMNLTPVDFPSKCFLMVTRMNTIYEINQDPMKFRESTPLASYFDVSAECKRHRQMYSRAAINSDSSSPQSAASPKRMTSISPLLRSQLSTSTLTALPLIRKLPPYPKSRTFASPSVSAIDEFAPPQSSKHLLSPRLSLEDIVSCIGTSQMHDNSPIRRSCLAIAVSESSTLNLIIPKDLSVYAQRDIIRRASPRNVYTSIANLETIKQLEPASSSSSSSFCPHGSFGLRSSSSSDVKHIV